MQQKNSAGLFTAVRITAACLLTVCAAIIFNVSLRRGSRPVYAVTSQAVSESTPPQAQEPAPPASLPSRQAELADSKTKNPDTVGWLTVPGTSLDLPVLQTTDNEFYLKHNFEKQSYKKGWPFLDFRCYHGIRNTIIYGHNMGDGTVFGQLKKYKQLDYLNQNPVLYYSVSGIDQYWKIFAVYVTDVNFYYIKTDFKSDDDFAEFLSQIHAQSLFSTGVDVTPQDRILTLSTCSYEFDDARFVVQARLVRQGEGYDVPAAVENPSAASPHHKKQS